MRRWRSRIVSRRHRPRYIRRALIIIPHRRRLRRWEAHVGTFRRALGQPLYRSAIGVFQRTGRVRAPHVGTARILPRYCRRAAIQNRARSRSRAPDPDKPRTYPDLLHRRHGLTVEIQSLLMIHRRSESVVASPRSCGYRATIDRHQSQPPDRVNTSRRPRPVRHRPSRRMSAHNNDRRPYAATAWGPSPTEGVIVPGAAMVGQPAPRVA
jgi:hypothetical protein